MLFLIIPTIILYIIFVLWISGLFMCSLYARFSKRKVAALQKVKSSSAMPTVTSLDNKSGRNVTGISVKRRLAKSINLYLYGLCRYYSILIGRIPSQRIRNFLMRHALCMDISPKTILYGGFEVRSPWNIHIGESVIGVGALLDGRSGIKIEDRVCLAQNVKLFTLQHDVNDPHFAAVGGV